MKRKTHPGKWCPEVGCFGILEIVVFQIFLVNEAKQLQIDKNRHSCATIVETGQQYLTYTTAIPEQIFTHPVLQHPQNGCSLERDFRNIVWLCLIWNINNPAQTEVLWKLYLAVWDGIKDRSDLCWGRHIHNDWVRGEKGVIHHHRKHVTDDHDISLQTTVTEQSSTQPVYYQCDWKLKENSPCPMKVQLSPHQHTQRNWQSLHLARGHPTSPLSLCSQTTRERQ